MQHPYPHNPAGSGHSIARACAQPFPAGWSQHWLAFVQSTLAAKVLQYVVLIFAFLYAAGASAQITSGFELDGNAVKTTGVDDWDRIKNNTSNASVTTGIITDAAIPTDNIFFSGGSKDDLDITGWRWTGGSTTDKGDLLHGGAALYGDKLYFFGDRFATDGTASIGFWLLQNQISLNPNGTFNGTHKVGDLLILSEFTNGGAVSNIKAYKWVGGGSPLQELSVTGTSLFAIVNNALIDSPWPYQAKDGSVPTNKIAAGGFFEGGIDLAAVQASIDPCFTTFLIRTRVSQQANAILDDFLLGSFFTKPKVTVNSGQKCDDGSGFTVTATVQGGVGPLTYDWTVPAGATDPGNVASFQATVTGTYSVVVTGANGCASDPASGSVTLKPALGLTLNKTNVQCNSANDGTITAQASGGPGTYTYKLIQNGNVLVTNTNGIFTNLADGTYTVEVSAANSCPTSKSISITEPPVLSLSASSVNVLCNGAATGSIDLSVTGGTSPYTYAWSNGATSQDLNNLQNGTYTVTVTDAKGCEKTLSKTITEPPVLSLSATVTDVLCNGASTGSINLSVSGGNDPYTYLWSNGATTQDISNLQNGTYTVTVTDANGCEKTLSKTVNEPAVLSLSATVTDVLCNGASTGSINLSVSGGNDPYTYEWSNGATSQDVSGLAAGTYTVTVTDANGCEKTLSKTITQPAVLSLSATVTDVLCNGASTGSINLSVSGGNDPYTYLWSNGATTQDISGLPNGTYTVTVTDANGCEKTLTKTVNEPAALSLSATVADVLCNGASTGSINLSVSGGNDPYTYEWSNGATSQDISGLQNGTYTVTVTDANGCQKTLSKTVNEPAALSLSATVTDVLCNGASTGSINLSVSGGNDPYTYLWSNGATTQDISNLQNGTYTVTVTDANGCQKTLSKTVNEPAALNLSATVTDVLCNGASTGSINLSVSGGNDPYTYLWSNGATTQDISGLQNGTYTVTVTDANGCEKTLSKTVNEPAALSLSATVTDVLCNGASTGSINLSVSGGNDPYTYLWSNGATTQDISGLAAGTYTVTVTDANGCEKTLSKTINQPAVLSLSATVTDVLCNGASTGSINLSVSGGNDPYTYLWSNGATTQDISGLPNGTYTVTVTDANGCEKTLTKTVNEPAALSLSATVADVLCNGASTGSINLSVSGGNDPYTYEWSNGATSQDISGLAAGTYTVTVTDANGCEKTLSKTINQPAALSLSATVADVLCNGASTGSINLSVSGGNDPYTYEWSNGATSQDVSGLAAGTYTVTVTDANGCEKTLSKTITQPAVLSLSAAVTDVLCNGASTGSINLSVSGGNDPYTYLWSNGATSQDISGLAAGTYTVTVTDANGCQKTLSKTVNQPAALSLSATVTQVLCNGASTGSINLSVSGGNDPYTYLWSNGATTQDISGLAAGNYTVTVTDANGCQKTLSKTITQPPAIVLTATQVNMKCNGASTGSINLSVSGGNDPYTYLWSNGATSQDISGLAAGTYTVTVTDANGCQKTLSKTITQPAKLVVSCVLKSDETNCANNGSLSANVSGGVGPYTYEWKNSQGAVVATTQTATGLGAGTYTVTVKDANYCTASSTCQVRTAGFRTQTQGGWGTLPSGSNPGAYMRQTVTVGGVTKTRFAHAFPNGVVVGDIYTDNCYKYTLKLTSPAAVSAFLPSGGTARALTQSLTNPTRESYSNVFAGQVVALTLSVGFDNKFSDFGSSTTPLKDLFVLSGPFKGKTVGQVLAEANKKLGGCASVYTFTQLNDAVSSINQNFVDGQAKGSFLGCDNPNALVAAGSRQGVDPETAETALEPIRLSAFPNPAYGVATIEFTVAKTGPAALEVYNTRGDKVKTLFNGVAEGGKAYQVTLQTDDRIVPGAYIYRVQAGSDSKSSRLIMIKQ